MAHLPIKSILGATAVTVAIGATGVAYSTQAEETAASSNDKALQMLRDWSRHIDGLEAYSAEVTQNLKMSGPLGDEDSTNTFTVAAKKPNHFAVVTDMNEAVVSDGENVYVSIPMFQSYVKQEAPDDLKSVMSYVQSETMMLASLPAPLVTPLLAPGGVDGDLATLHEATYHGVEEIDGTELHHISLHIKPTLSSAGRSRVQNEMGPNAQIEYFIDAYFSQGDDLQLQRLNFDLARMLAVMMPDMFEMMPEMKEMTYDMAMTFSNWKTGGDVSDDAFAFHPPESAEEHESVDAMMAAAMEAAGGPGASPMELVGELAPDYELQLLSGETVTSQQHKGNDIVILDFWATWCGPCIQAMPALIEVSEKYKDRNVVFYAVNVREAPEAVEKFVSERNWDIMVPLDRDGSVGNKFKVGGIPQTVIIDKDGSVQAVHIGFSPNLKQQLSSELDTLLAGEKLAQ